MPCETYTDVSFPRPILRGLKANVAESNIIKGPTLEAICDRSRSQFTTSRSSTVDCSLMQLSMLCPGGGGTTGRGGDFERPWAPQVGNFWQTLNINAGPGIGKFEQC